MSGFWGKIISAVRVTKRGIPNADIKTSGKGGANVTADHAMPPGYDALPLDGDFGFFGAGQRSGSAAVSGYADSTEKKAVKGESRLYARDESGALVAEIWLKKTGEIVMENENGGVTLSAAGAITGQNSNGSFALQSGGNFVVNGVTIDPSGNISGIVNVDMTGAISGATEATIGGIAFTTHTNGGYSMP